MGGGGVQNGKIGRAEREWYLTDTLADKADTNCKFAFNCMHSFLSLGGTEWGALTLGEWPTI